MTVIAYRYSDPLLDAPEQDCDWGRTVDKVYHDLGGRWEWEQLLHDCRQSRPETILVRSWGELGDTLEEVRGAIAQLEAFRSYKGFLARSRNWKLTGYLMLKRPNCVGISYAPKLPSMRIR